MKKTIFVLLDACQYEAGTRNLGYLEHLIDYKKGAKYKVKGELPSLSRPMYAALLTGTPVFSHGITTNDTLRTLDCDNVFSLCQKQGGKTEAAAYHWFGELYNHIPFRIDRERIQLQSSETIQMLLYNSRLIVLQYQCVIVIIMFTVTLVISQLVFKFQNRKR